MSVRKAMDTQSQKRSVGAEQRLQQVRTRRRWFTFSLQLALVCWGGDFSQAFGADPTAASSGNKLPNPTYLIPAAASNRTAQNFEAYLAPTTRSATVATPAATPQAPVNLAGLPNTGARPNQTANAKQAAPATQPAITPATQPNLAGLPNTGARPNQSVAAKPTAAAAQINNQPTPAASMSPLMVRLAAQQEEVRAKTPSAPVPAPATVKLPTPEAPVVEQPSGPLTTLGDLEQLALGSHPQIASTSAELTAAHGRAIQAGLYPNPVLSFASPQMAGDESQYNSFVSQDIVTRGKLRLQQNAVYQEVAQSELQIIRARFDVLTDVRKQFYATLASQQRVFLLKELVKIAVRSEQIGNARLEAKLDSKIDTLLLGVELSKQQVALVNAETVLNTNRRQLAAAIGVPDLNIGTLAGDLSVTLPELEMIGVQGQVQQNNALLGIAEAEIRKNEFLLGRAIVEPFPNVNVMGGYQRALVGVKDQALFQVSLPLPLWNRNQGNIQAAQANVQKSTAQLRQVQVSLAAITADALARYQTSQQLVKKYTDQILPRSRESLLLTQRRYQEGEINFLELLQAQRTMNEVNLSYIDAQELRWKAAAEIASLIQVERLTGAEEIGPAPVPAAAP